MMPALPKNPSSMTKERLAEELRRNNVPLPSARSKKEVYVELYQQHLLDDEASPQFTAYRNMSVNTSPKLGFSSDEEDDVVVPKIKKSALNMNNNSNQRNATKKVTKTLFEDRLAEVEELSNADLRRELQGKGIKAGPIVGSTRAVYERKLADVLTNPQQDDEQEVAQENGDSQESVEEMENGYSDSDVDEGSQEAAEDNEEDQMEQTESTRTSSRTTSSYKSQVTRLIDRESSSQPRQRSVTPKRHIETASTEKTEQVVTKTSSKKVEERGKPLVPVWLQLLIFAIIAFFLMLIWYNMETGKNDSDLLT